jgi:hypothetical protein
MRILCSISIDRNVEMTNLAFTVGEIQIDTE